MAISQEKKEAQKQKKIEEDLKIKIKEQTLKEEIKIEKEKNSALAVPALEQEKSITIRTTSKPYSGFQGVVVTPKAKQYPEGAEGAAMELLDNWDELSSRDAAKAQQKLESLLREMSYEELRDIYEATANPVVEGAMYQSWLTTMRSGENGLRVSRTSGTETEPNNSMSAANAMATDTVSAYLTANKNRYPYTRNI